MYGCKNGSPLHEPIVSFSRIGKGGLDTQDHMLTKGPLVEKKERKYRKSVKL